jgi:predicted DCC family thiol-disulfide oxidoreductase YuxK
MSTHKKFPELVVVFDGDCPFCSQYVQLLKLGETVGATRLINARSGDPIAIELQQLGYDLNQGMVVRHKGQTYYGADGVHVLACLTTSSKTFNRINNVIFGSLIVSRALYPILRFGRSAALRLRGKSKI